MFEKELTEKDALAIQQILELMDKSNDYILDYNILWLKEPNWIDRSLFNFYILYILSINPKVIEELAESDSFIKTDRLRSYLEEGGFLKTFKIYQNKKADNEKYQRLVVEELESSISNSKLATRNAYISNIIAILALIIAVLTYLFKK